MTAAKLDVVVIGAGCFGLACALALARGSARVRVFDPRPRDNASHVAGGMLAPFSERLLDRLDDEGGEALARAYALWPRFADEAGVAIAHEGAVHLADPETLATRLRTLQTWGVEARPLTAAQARGKLAGARTEGALWLADEARLDAEEALPALERALVAAGGRVLPERVEAAADGGFAVAGRPLRADLVVVATGDGSMDLARDVPELAVLTPIQGQLLRLAVEPRAGPTVRTPSAYLVPQAGGVLVGATMVEGVTDLAPDADATLALRRAAAEVWPFLADAPGRDKVGVRVAAPDGLPLVGWSARPGVLIATGARRNGWLLAPLVAGMVAAYAAGEDPGPFASAFSPARFAGPTG